jgi:hypothetical protein
MRHGLVLKKREKEKKKWAHESPQRKYEDIF